MFQQHNRQADRPALECFGSRSLYIEITTGVHNEFYENITRYYEKISPDIDGFVCELKEKLQKENKLAKHYTLTLTL